jgi:hypothetical protein
LQKRQAKYGNLTISEHETLKEAFKIEAISHGDLRELNHAREYKNLFLLYIFIHKNVFILLTSYIIQLKRIHEIQMKPNASSAEKTRAEEDTMRIFQTICKSLVKIMKYVIGLPKEVFPESYEDIVLLIKDVKFNKIKQDILRQFYFIEIMFKIMSHIWNNHLRSHFESETKQNEGELLKWAKKLYKFGDLFLTLMIRGSKGGLKIINELEITHFLINQLSTPWNLTIYEFFKLAKEDPNMKVLNREGIHKLVNHLYYGIQNNEHKFNILDLLSSICLHKEKSDKQIQALVFEMLIGRPSLLYKCKFRIKFDINAL